MKLLKFKKLFLTLALTATALPARANISWKSIKRNRTAIGWASAALTVASLGYAERLKSARAKLEKTKWVRNKKKKIEAFDTRIQYATAFAGLTAIIGALTLYLTR